MTRSCSTQLHVYVEQLYSHCCIAGRGTCIKLVGVGVAGGGGGGGQSIASIEDINVIACLLVALQLPHDQHAAITCTVHYAKEFK